MAVSLGSAYGEIVINTAGVTKGISEAQRSVSSFQRSMQSIGNSMTKVGKGLTVGVTLPLLAIGKQAVETATDFESQMNILSVAARNAGTGMDELREAALAVGGDTRLVGVSASEAADAMTNFYKAGMTTTDIFGDLNSYLEEGTELTGAMRAAVDLAAASNLDLASASDAVAIAMATFGLNAEEATEIADSFVQAADASVAEVEELVAAMANVGPTAAAFGWSLDDVNTALALLSERGIRGAEAGTALKSMMTNLMRTTPDVVETLANLNVELYNTDGTMRSLPEIIGQLSRSMAGLTEEQRNQAVQTLAGTYGMKAMNTLLAEGVDGWADMSEAMSDAASAQEVAAARTEGLAAAWEQFQGVLETLMIEVGTPLIKNFLTPLVQKASDVLSAVQQQHPEWLKWGTVIGGVAAATGPLLIGLGQTIKVIGTISRGVGTAIRGVAALGTAIKGGMETAALSAMYAGEAITGLASSIGISTAALLGPLGLVAAVGAAILALNKMEKARREEAAGILEASQSYGDYIRAMEDADRGAYQVSESLYEVAKAAQETDGAFDAMELQDARKDVRGLAQDWKSVQEATIETAGATDELDRLTEAMTRQVGEMSDLELVVAGNKEEMAGLAQSLGYSAEEALAFADAMAEAVQAQQLLNLAMEASTVSIGDHEERMLGLTEAAGTAAQRLLAVAGADAEMAASLGTVEAMMAGANEAMSNHSMAAFRAAEAERELAEAAAEAAEAEAAFNNEMAMLQEAISGTVGEDFAALAGAYAELAEATASGAENIQEMTAALAAQRAAFEENTNAMIYNIAEGQIMQALEQGLIQDVNQSGSAYDEASGALVRLAEKMGMVDQGTVLLTDAILGQGQAWLDGTLTTGEYIASLDVVSGEMADAAEQGQAVDQAIRNAKSAMQEASEPTQSLGRDVGDLSGRLLEATGSASGLSGELNSIPRDIKVNINVKTSYSGGPPPVIDPATGAPVMVGEDYAYQHGGQFMVRGVGGIDRVPVGFMATAGEVVTVTPRGQTPPPDPRNPNAMVQTLIALVATLERMQSTSAGGGSADQNWNVYGGLHLAGVNDTGSLLEQLQGLSL